jgi:hypothetical protein
MAGTRSQWLAVLAVTAVAAARLSAAITPVKAPPDAPDFDWFRSLSLHA